MYILKPDTTRVCRWARQCAPVQTHVARHLSKSRRLTRVLGDRGERGEWDSGPSYAVSSEPRKRKRLARESRNFLLIFPLRSYALHAAIVLAADRHAFLSANFSLNLPQRATTNSVKRRRGGRFVSFITNYAQPIYCDPLRSLCDRVSNFASFGSFFVRSNFSLEYLPGTSTRVAPSITERV